MTTRENMLQHLEKGVQHHADRAARWRKIAKSHGELAKAHRDGGESVIAQHHEDLAHHANESGDHHEARQNDYERLREHWAGLSGADVIDEHSRGGDVARALQDLEYAERMEKTVGS